jgi:transposase InsO family protein
MLVRRIKNKRKTAFSKHRMHKYPNLTCDYTPTAPNQLWVSDITYLETANKFIYPSLITDVYSHKIVGRNLALTLRASNAIKALRMALNTLPAQKQYRPIHHSDRGSRYCCARYVNLLNKHNVLISMTERGYPRENAVAERVNGILKTDRPNIKTMTTLAETSDFVSKIIDLYNNQRPHQSIGYMVPAVIHKTGRKTERKRKSYYRPDNREYPKREPAPISNIQNKKHDE